MPQDRLTLTVAETASRLGISLNTAYEAIKRKEIPSVRLGRRVVVPLAALESFLATCGEAARTAAP